MKLNSYLKKHKNEVRTLNVFDIDDTLFDTEAKVGVIKDGKRIKNLAPGEYNTYILKTGEKLDFGQFRSGKFFRDTSKPIRAVLNRAKSVIKNQNSNSLSIIITARADMKEKDDFLQTFRDNGFPIDQVYVERAGNLPHKTHTSKALIIMKYLKDQKFDRVQMWDDSEENLNALLRIGKIYPNIEVMGYLVKNGKVSPYVRKEPNRKNLTETIRIVVGESLWKKVYLGTEKSQI